MVITILDTVKSVADAATIEKVVKASIQYWGHYSGTVQVGQGEVEYRRDRSNKEMIEIVVDTPVTW